MMKIKLIKLKVIKKILLIFIFTILVVGFVYPAFNFFQTETAKAGSEHNVSGWAWSEIIGWISFNNTSGGGTVSYGVNIDQTTGNFFGFAWSENIGWIQFNPSGPYPSSPNYSAKLNLTNNKVEGWARVLAGSDGWDGWIKMDGTASDGSSYGVSRSGCDLIGYAWGSDVVGWIRFNGTNYKVVTTFCENQSPSAFNLQVFPPDYCVSGPAAIFSWTFSDPDSDTQSKFQFQVDNNSDFTSPEVDRTIDGLSSPSPSTNNQTVVVAVSPTADQIGYKDTYYWRVKVWDSKGLSSSWIYPLSPPGSPTPAPGTSFSTPKHAYPTIDFTWFPANPSANENVQFTDQSTCYDLNNNPTLCSGISLCDTSWSSTWCWRFQDGSPDISSQQNPIIKFLSDGSKLVILKVTDSDGYICPGSKTVNVQWKLPKWKEIFPW